MRHPTDQPEGAIPWPTVRILVFSQDDAFHFLVRSTFRKLQVRDLLASTSADNAEHMVSHAPDVAVVDFDDDPGTAQGFISRLKTMPRNPNPGMPILAAIKTTDRAALEPVMKMGIVGIIPKPVSGHELAIRVAAALTRHTAHHAQRAALSDRPRPAVRPHIPVPSSSPRSVPVVPAAPPPVKRPDPGIETAPPPPKRDSAPIETVEAKAPAPKKPQAPIETVQAAPPPPPKPSTPIEVLAAKAPAQYRIETREEDEAGRRAAQRRHEAWQAAIAKSGHVQRKGGDVDRLDVTAIVEAHLEWLNSQGARGSRANVKGMDLAGADFTHAVLANATFREADLSDVQMVECRLDGADFRYATLDAADLSGSNLGVAQLRHAKARLCNLENVNLRGCDLSGADLRASRLSGADFKGATMISTDLRGTDLSQVENLAQSQLDKAVADIKTKLPPGLSRPEKKTD